MSWCRSRMLAQQTAANLHAAVGTMISIGRPGLPPLRVRVRGIVDLPAAGTHKAHRCATAALNQTRATSFPRRPMGSRMANVEDSARRRLKRNRALAGGMPADILVLDWDAVDHERLRPELDPQDML